MRRSMVWFAFSALAAQVTALAFNTHLQFFYVDVQHMSVGLYATIMSISAIWNAINNPLAGALGDATRTRWGRRIPYLRFGLLPLAVAFALLWWPPGGSAIAWYLPVVLFVYDIGYTVVFLNTSALFPEMFPDLQSRATANTWRQILATVGLLIGVALPPVLAGMMGWGGMGVLISVVTVGSLLLTLRGVWENPANSERQPLPFWQAFAATVLNRSFVWYVLAISVVQIGFGMLTSTADFYVKYTLGLQPIWATIMLGVIFLAAMPAMPLWSKVAIRLGSRATMMAATAWIALALIPFAFVRSGIGAVLTAVGFGIGLAGALLMFDVLCAEIVDEDELRTGVRREGAYFGIQAFFIRLGGIVPPLAFAAVSVATGYVSGQATQGAAVAAGFRSLMSWWPLATMALTLLFLWLYPLHGRRLQEVQQRLTARKPAA